MKILVLTSVYKDNSLGTRDISTNIVNSFVKEWKKQEHEVIVVHNAHNYPKIIHTLPLKLRRKLASVINFQIPDYEVIEKKVYSEYGAIIYRCPIKKYIPYKSPSNRRIVNQVRKIQKFLEKNNFNPDIIIGHWASPQIEIAYYLKNIYNCKTAVVLHGLSYINDKKFKIDKYIKNIDKIGCRSYNMAIEAQKILKLDYTPFICYSGIPDEYLGIYKLNLSKFEGLKKWKLIFVGRLIAYKNVDIIIKALSTFKNIDWELNIIGEGTEKENLEKLSYMLQVNDRVHFLGRIPRDDVMEKMKESNIFVMVSNNEVFGLVYLEAMAASCITVACKNGGVDGIIVDNYNGFLCNQGDEQHLIEKLKYIFNMKNNEINNIVTNGYEKVKEYSDSNVAREYLENIIKNQECN